MQTIDLDCAPGGTRPGDLILGVVQDTPAAAMATPDNAVSRFFGNWTWEFDIPREVWEAEVQPVVKPRIEELHALGYIRYGSW